MLIWELGFYPYIWIPMFSSVAFADVLLLYPHLYDILVLYSSYIQCSISKGQPKKTDLLSRCKMSKHVFSLVLNF